MNEKIKTILRIVKPGYIPLGYYTPQGSFNSWGMSDEELQKFAELIIRECGKVIINGGYRNPAFGDKYPLTPTEIAKMIEEHFGVE